MANSFKPIIFFERLQLNEIRPFYDLTHDFPEGCFIQTLRPIWLVVDEQRWSNSESGEATAPHRGLGDDNMALNFPWPIILILEQGW